MNKRYKSKLSEERKNKNGNSRHKKNKEEFSISVDIKKQLIGFLFMLFGMLLLLQFYLIPKKTRQISTG